MGELLIYVKNPEQIKQFKEKYPEVKAEYIEGKSLTEAPLVCMNDNGNETCEVGEKYIKQFWDKLSGSDEV